LSRALLIRLLRLFIGGIILVPAVGKSLGLRGFAQVLETYQAFPTGLLIPRGLLVTSIELALGIWLLWGWRLTSAARASIALNAGYAVWLLISLWRGLTLSNCGCFGVFFPQPLTWLSPVEDLVLVSLCYALSCLARDQT
jgi:hypothetical protein